MTFYNECREELIKLYEDECNYKVTPYMAPEQMPDFESRQVRAVIQALDNRLREIYAHLDKLGE